MTPLENYHRRVRELGCVICRRLGYGETPASLHHIAKGSGLRSKWSVCPLCPTHHLGKAGFHTLGTERFCSLYHVPGEAEWGLLLFVIEDLAKYGSRLI